MINLFRRPSGIYVFRLAVPEDLRWVFKKSEIIATTGTTELLIAKMVAATLATQWRQKFLDASRLLMQAHLSTMDPSDILKIAHGNPLLLGGGHLPLPAAAAASGIGSADLLRAASDGKLALFIRTPPIRGHLVERTRLELVDPAQGFTGGYVIPNGDSMPSHAVEFTAEGMLRIPELDLPGVTASCLAADEPVEVVVFDLPARPTLVFAPVNTIKVKRDNLEVAVSEVETLRRGFASSLNPERVKDALAQLHAASQAAEAPNKKPSNHRLIEALDLYVANRVRHTVAGQNEIKRIKNGCALLIELEGNVLVSEIDAPRLRTFRDAKLVNVPAKENKVRLMFGSTSVADSIAKVHGTDWPKMTASEREKRMRWIAAWFHWMHEDQRWIPENPAAALRGEHVLTKAERRKAQKNSRRADEARDAFSDDDLQVIFSAPWFKIGRGELTKQNTYRTFSPVRYWLPLLGVYTGGGRINELCQLHLNDVGRGKDGIWYVDINDDGDDKSLKNAASKRRVPLHPALLDLGFDRWVAALRSAGYTRVFPELKHDEEKGYGKAATKWFTTYMASLGFPRDGKKTFHSFRHTFVNALPTETPDRIRRQLTGHDRGTDTHDKTYRKDVDPSNSAKWVNQLAVKLPEIAPFEIEAGLHAIEDALRRKDRGRGADEDIGA